MSNKKGFTLVELLAVIAILAILVIIAMPNVLNMFMNAKKSSFITEAQNVIKQVTNKYIDESLKGNHISTISNDNNPLDLSGNIKYEIEIDSQGNVTSYIISNDSYCISSSKKYNELTKDDVKDDCSYESLHNVAGTLSKDFYSKTGRTAKDVVSSITFYSDGRTIDATEKYDVSEAQDNSIIMYVNPTNENSSLIDLTIVANGKIMFPEDSTKLFYFRSEYPCGYYAVNLSKLEFNSSIDTSKVKSMNSMFRGIITEVIDLSEFNTANVEDMSSLFYESEVKEIKGLEKFNTSKVTNMSDMFYYSRATTLDLSNFDTSNVTNMSGMFRYSSATTLDLSSFDTRKVTNMSGMFAWSRSSATTLNLSSFDTSNVTNMSYMFAATKVENLNLSVFNTSNVTNMMQMFYNSPAKEIKGLEKFNTSKVTNMSYMFAATKVENLNLSVFNTSNVTDMSGMFNASSATTLDLSSFDTSKVTNMSSMFSNSKATTLDLSSFDTSKVTSMWGMFLGSSATTLDLSSFNTSKVTTMSYMFKNSKATTLDLSSFDTSKVTSMWYMFDNTAATKGYAKDSATASKFNSIKGKPSRLIFTVK